MTPLVIHLDGELPQIKPGRRVVYLGAAAQPIRVAVLTPGTGRPHVAIRLDLADGTVVIAETSARLFCAAAKAIMAAHPKLFEGGD